ncbi:MAG: hypothetical protein E7509_01825 [Ruminococcus sp.]|nr:hypothetical protein [Ruminococcus sp.]
MTGVVIGAAIIVVVISAVLLLQGISLSKKDFFCKNCNYRFNRKWYQVIFLTHFENEFSVKCPQCGKKYTNAVEKE